MRKGDTLTTVLTDQPSAGVYGSAVTHERDVEAARRAIKEEQEAQDAHTHSLDVRDAAVVAALASAPDHMSDNEVARQLGLSPSTFRSITAEFRKKRRTRGR